MHRLILQGCPDVISGSFHPSRFGSRGLLGHEVADHACMLQHIQYAFVANRVRKYPVSMLSCRPICSADQLSNLQTHADCRHPTLWPTPIRLPGKAAHPLHTAAPSDQAVHPTAAQCCSAAVMCCFLQPCTSSLCHTPWLAGRQAGLSFLPEDAARSLVLLPMCPADTACLLAAVKIHL